MQTKPRRQDDTGSAAGRPPTGSMCRAIYCGPCSKAVLAAHGVECCRAVPGLARDLFFCDRCNRPLPPGDRCVAMSMFDHPGDYRPWEDEYLAAGVAVDPDGGGGSPGGTDERNTDGTASGDDCSTPTRPDAADGGPVDVTDAARGCGFLGPVAVTRGLWEAHVADRRGTCCPGEYGRLLAILWAAKGAVAGAHGVAAATCFPVFVRHHVGEEPAPVAVRAVWNGDADGPPRLTLMRPGEE